jgi:protein-L-isoaspartate(D-aspartate) O-methyltransferase
LTCTNNAPGEFSQILQAFGVDGRKVSSLDVSLWAKGRNIRPPLAQPTQRPKLLITFYNQKRAELTARPIGGWTGTFDWEQRKDRIPVPRDARLAVLYLGMAGATGEISFDKVAVRAVENKP